MKEIREIKMGCESVLYFSLHNQISTILPKSSETSIITIYFALFSKTGFHATLKLTLLPRLVSISAVLLLPIPKH